jgi:hypothetical protein
MQISEDIGSELRSANDWIRGAKKRPVPRPLFGEFWREGETAVLFGDTGKGKSALAMQIAESIASGQGIGPFKLSVEPQRVLYLDMEMNDKQFETRYAADHDGGQARFLHKHYVFADGLIREEFDPTQLWVESGARPADVFYRKLRQLIERSGVTVVIVDSITGLKRSYYGIREMLEVILALKKLRKEFHLSVLALVQTPKHSDSLPITANLPGLRMLAGRADSVFGIGQSRSGPAGRYIKRVRALVDTIDFDGLHVPEFRLKKIGGNFLGFDFEQFAPELELVSDIRDQKEWETIEKIKGLSDGGMSIREIAAEIELPKTTVHRLLQMWRPPVREAAEIEEVGSEYYFPGREEFDEALADPKFKGMFSSDEPEKWALRREYGLIENAAAKARREYEATGTFTPLDDDPEYVEFLTFGLEGRPPDDPPGSDDDDDDTAMWAENTGPGRNGDTSFASRESSVMDGLAHTLDKNGREIFVERKNDSGRPLVWYLPLKGGKFTRFEWIPGVGNIGTAVDGPVCMFDSHYGRASP